MNALKKACLILVLVLTLSPLGGCESIDSAMTDVKDTFASMDLKMPTITPREDGQVSKGPMENPSAATTQHDYQDMGEETHKTAFMQANEPITTMDDIDEAIQSAAAKDQNAVGDGLEATELEKTETAAAADNCPPVSVIDELNALYQFKNPNNPTPSGKISSIKITDLKTSCKFNPNNVAVEIDLTFQGELGPQAKIWNTDKPSFAYPYFLAITTPNGNIVAKEVFAATVSYENDEQTLTHNESLRQIIPLKGVYDEKHTLLIGFQLTEGELAYNRAVKNVPPHAIETSAGTEQTAKAKAKPMSITPQRKPENVVVSKEPEPAPVKVVSETLDNQIEIETLTEEGADETTDDTFAEEMADETESMVENTAEAVGEAIEDTMESVEETGEQLSDSMIDANSEDTGIVRPETHNIEPPPIEQQIDDAAIKALELQDQNSVEPQSLEDMIGITTIDNN